MKNHKVLLGLLCILMAFGEILMVVVSLPGTLEYCEAQEEWYFAYLPTVLFLNSIIATIVLCVTGAKFLESGTELSIDEKESKLVDIIKFIKRWSEKKKYGYVKSDYESIENIGRPESTRRENATSNNN